MAIGDLGAKILRLSRHQDVEIEGIKIRVREITGLKLFAVRNALKGATETSDPEVLFEKIMGGDANFVPSIIAESCVDTESGEAVFTLEQVKTLPASIFVKLFQTIMAATQPPEAAGLKA